MVGAGRRCSPALAVVGGLLDLPFKRIECLDEWLEPVFADAHHEIAATVVPGRRRPVGAGDRHGPDRARRRRCALYRRGLESVDRDPFAERLGFFGRLFGHAYYFDEGISRTRRRPGARLRRLAGPGRSTPAIIDGAVNGVGWLVRETGGGLRQVADRLVRNYALGVVLGTVALLVYLLVWAAR